MFKPAARERKKIIMFKTITTLLSFTTLVASTEDNGYYNNAPAHGYPQQGPAYGGAYGGNNGYPAHGGYYRKTFPRPQPVLDPKFYKGVLLGFRQCVEHKCDTQPRAYTTTPKESLLTVGAYTACITSCAASEMMRVTADFKALVAKLFDIGSAHLNDAHRYLAGKGDYDVLKSNTRIEDSCCLPNEYFVPWNDLVFWARVKFDGDKKGKKGWQKLLISVKTYYDYCLQDSDSIDYEKYVMGKFKIKCNKNWAKYLRALQLNAGHLVLAPKCKNLAPKGACSKKLRTNPQAEEFGEAMCVAYECTVKGKTKSVEHPILKYPLSGKFEKSCPPEESDDGESVIKFHRVPRHALTYYALPTGLPGRWRKKGKGKGPIIKNGVALAEDAEEEEEEEESLLEEGLKRRKRRCQYGFGLVREKGDRMGPRRPPSYKDIKLAERCPRHGRFEYCNMKQYVNWLQDQLFNVGGCPLVTKNPSEDSYDDYTLVCLFRIISLKCDCMEAVLNCYEHEYKFTSELGKTIGKAASVLCGFLLCQKPQIYSLLGGQSAIERANIMGQVLMNLGVVTPSVSSLPPATFAFLSFGLGMVCVFVVSKVSKKAMKVGMDDGYRNLI